MKDQIRETVHSLFTVIVRGSVLFVVVCFFALPLLMACGIKGTGSEETSSQQVEHSRPALHENTLTEDKGNRFDGATKVVIQDDHHPWDGSKRDKAIGQKSDENNAVPNGDSMPPELNRQSALACSTLQSNRCVSCCEDANPFGSEKWDQCVATCPQLDVQQMTSEY